MEKKIAIQGKIERCILVRISIFGYEGNMRTGVHLDFGYKGNGNMFPFSKKKM
jgi:hypothetical protein